MKNTKTRPMLFSFYDRSGIESYLEKQAEEGWLLEKATAFSLRFSRIEPRKTHFAVTYFPEATVFDPAPNDKQATLLDFCEHAGWKLVASNVEMQIFRNDRENPVPIETDALMEVEQIHASAIGGFLLPNALLICIAMLLLQPFVRYAQSLPIALITDNVKIFGVLCIILLIALCLLETTRYLLWRRKALATAKLDGSFTETKGMKGVSLAAPCLLLASVALSLMCRSGNHETSLALAAIALVGGAAAVVARFSGTLKMRKTSAWNNFAATCIVTFIVFVAVSKSLSFLAFDDESPIQPSTREPAETYIYEDHELNLFYDDLPLTIEDLVETDYDGYSYDLRSAKSSLLAEQLDVYQHPRWGDYEQPRIEYTVTEARIPLLAGVLRACAMDDFVKHYINSPLREGEVEAVEIEAAPWGADEAYQAYRNGEPGREYLLYYGSRVVKISFPSEWTPTKEQMATIGQKLGEDRNLFNRIDDNR